MQEVDLWLKGGSGNTNSLVFPVGEKADGVRILNHFRNLKLVTGEIKVAGNYWFVTLHKVNRVTIKHIE